MNNKKSDIELSVVCTIYNDAEVVPVLVEEIRTWVEELNILYEIILVNDFSYDPSDAEIKRMCCKFENVKGITLARNYGQQIAMSAGIRHAIGKYVIIMDGDLQNPPSEIPHLYNEIRKGYDIVYTISNTRNNVIDKFTSRVFWLVLTKIFRVEIVPNQLMLKIMTRKFVDCYDSYNEINRTIAGIVRDISANFSVITVENSVRFAGNSHYDFFSRFNLLIDIVISLSNAPLNIMIYFGCIIFFITNSISLYYLINFFMFDVPPGFTSIMLAISFFGSLIVLLLGFIGRYLSNIYTEVRQRPLFHVQNYYNIDFE